MGQGQSGVVVVRICNVEEFLREVLEELQTLRIQSEKIKEEFTEWIRDSNSVNIFVTGKTGAGKSTLVNALIGKKVAQEGEDLDPMTAEVTCYECSVSGVQVKVWDSPGLQDGTQREEEYIADMKKKCKDIHLCLFCMNISTGRFTEDSTEIQAMQKLTDAFGHSLWEHAMIVLTYANEVEMRNDEMRQAKRKNDTEKLSKVFQEKVAEWDTKLRATLKNTVKLDPNCVKDLRIIPAGFREPSLPDRRHWLSTFWFSALRSMHRSAQPAMVLINHARIVESPESISENEKERFLEDQSLIFNERGYEIGEQVGNPELGIEIAQEMGDVFSNVLMARLLLEQLTIAKVIEQEKERNPIESVSGEVSDQSNI